MFKYLSIFAAYTEFAPLLNDAAASQRWTMERLNHSTHIPRCIALARFYCRHTIIWPDIWIKSIVAWRKINSSFLSLNSVVCRLCEAPKKKVHSRAKVVWVYAIVSTIQTQCENTQIHQNENGISLVHEGWCWWPFTMACGRTRPYIFVCFRMPSRSY